VYPVATGVLHSTEERRHCSKIGISFRPIRRKEFVQKRRSTVQQNGQGPEEEIRVRRQTLIVALASIRSHGVAIERAIGHTIRDIFHPRKQRTVERIIVAIVREVVVARKACVGFEAVVAVQSGLTTQQIQAAEGSGARCGIARDAQFAGDDVAVLAYAYHCENGGEVVVYVPKVLLCVEKFGVCGDAVARDESVLWNLASRYTERGRCSYVCGSIKTWTWSSYVVGCRRFESVRRISIGGYFDTTLSGSWQPIFRTGVWILAIEGSCWLVVGVEWAIGLSFLIGSRAAK
jgi:hypothetical protein